MKKSDFKLGEVVIVSTGQAGTICDLALQPCVILANGDIWYGKDHEMRYAQDQADLDAAPKDVDRFKNRPKPVAREE